MGTKNHPGGNRVRMSDDMLTRLIDWGNEVAYHMVREPEDEELLVKLEGIRDDRAASRARINNEQRSQ